MQARILLQPVTGFSLTVALVVVLVITVMLSASAPSMVLLLQGNQLRADSSRFLRALNLARSEAVMRNQVVSICPSPMAATGAAICTGDFEAGWIVFANQDKDKVVDADSDQVLQVFDGVSPGYRLTNRTGLRKAFKLINYLPDGASHSNRTLLFCPPPGGRAESVSIVINIVGRARLAKGRDRCA